MPGQLTIYDKIEITEKIHRYCFGVGRDDRAMLQSIALPNAIVDFGAIYKGEWKGYVEYMIDAHSKLLFHSHAISNVLIEGGDGTASSEAVVLGILLSRTPENGVVEIEFRARHLDKWRYVNGEWLIFERALARDYRRVTNMSADDYAKRYVISH